MAGRVEQVGAPLDLYHRPPNLFVAGFIGSPQMNFWDSEVLRRDTGATVLRLAGGGIVEVPDLPDGLHPGDPVTVGIRPEHIVVIGRRRTSRRVPSSSSSSGKATSSMCGSTTAGS